MISLNYGTEFKTRVAKGNIKKDVLVKVSNPGNYESKCTVKDVEGNEEEYTSDELIGFGVLKGKNIVFDIIEDYYRSQDKNGNKDRLYGHMHYTNNVRSSIESFKFWEDCLYAGTVMNSDHYQAYDYELRELTDQEVVDILLNEILYDYQPDLQSMSCVGTSAKGIDKEPNYRDGTYLLPNGKEYTMTWCRGVIKIREGVDGGWYSGKPIDECGKQIYEGEMDWSRYQQAIIKKESIRMLSRGTNLFKQYPEIQNIICEDIKDWDRFKMNSEFPKEEV